MGPGRFRAVPMREIIHIHAGRLSNFIGTHYFNTLETYFASAAGSEEIAHNVAFREGLAPDGSETFCPRLLLFDFKENFGALSNVSALYSDGLEEEDSEATAWYASTSASFKPSPRVKLRIGMVSPRSIDNRALRRMITSYLWRRKSWDYYLMILCHQCTLTP